MLLPAKLFIAPRVDPMDLFNVCINVYKKLNMFLQTNFTKDTDYMLL